MNLLNASGCLDALTAPKIAHSLDAFVTKTVTPLPREGNAPPRIAEVEHGMLNSIGLANPGIDCFVSNSLPRLAELGVPIWVSVGGFEVADYADLCDRLDDLPEVAAIELNVSCPNVDDVPASVGEIVAAARGVTRKPLYTKLSPSMSDLAGVAQAAQGAGTDGLSLVNTILGLALDEQTLQPRLSRSAGGLSGPTLKPIALAAVYACYAVTGLPIVGMGGISSGRDALEFFAAGASSVALGTILFSDSAAPARVKTELAGELERLGVDDPDNIIGLAHAEPTPHLARAERAAAVSR
ncbi:MAG TPA: dihydroorotate dehydrogenase [Gaiellaceae bacterium]